VSPDPAVVARKVCTEAIPPDAYPVSREVVLAVAEEAARAAQMSSLLDELQEIGEAFTPSQRQQLLNMVAPAGTPLSNLSRYEAERAVMLFSVTRDALGGGV
jgi:hypothetical protein